MLVAEELASVARVMELSPRLSTPGPSEEDGGT